MNRRHFLSALPVLAFAPRASACLWDTDTMAQEAKGNTDIIRVITGRFDRFPAKYYEMRLARVSELIGKSESDPSLFDDAGVACDRLGRNDEAIQWMVKKKVVLDLLPESETKKTHMYRYLANLGTFHSHRWLKTVGEGGNLQDIEKAVELIRAAIALNPNAHFGREKYQLIALEWILTIRRHANSNAGKRWNEECFLGIQPTFGPTKELKVKGFEDASTGVGGLVVLGSAWESVDIFYALCVIHTWRGEHSISALAGFRVCELLEAGRKSLRLDSTLTKELAGQPLFNPGASVVEHGAKDLAFYKAARKEADEWQKARHAYMETRFAQGKHPDVNPDFWSDWREPSQPPAYPR